MTNNHEKMDILLPVSDIHFGVKNMTKEQLAESLLMSANYTKSDSLPICLDGEDEYRAIQPRATDIPKPRDFAHQAGEHALIKRRGSLIANENRKQERLKRVMLCKTIGVKKDFFGEDTLIFHGHYHNRNDIKE